MEAKLDPIFQGQVDSKKIPGIAAVALNASGDVLFSKGYGHSIAGDTSSPKVTPQTPTMLHSCSKLVTSIAALQLVEQGKLNIDDPAEKYAPEIKDVPLLRGWNDDGSPQLSSPDKKILVLHLFTHTAGFSYDFFEPNTLKWRIAKGQPPFSYGGRGAMEEFTSPLLFEPGTRYEYGVNTDWLGIIVEKVSGLPLDKYCEQNILQPLGLKNTGSSMTPEQEKSYLAPSLKNADGILTPTPTKLGENREVLGGGHFLYSSVEDYAQILLAILAHGTHPQSKATILQPETVKKYIFTDMLPQVGCSNEGVGDVPTTMPQVSSTGTMLPGVSKGWSLAGMVNNESTPNGRSKGSASWAGLGNLYWWIDPEAGKLGFIGTAVLPFFDKDVLYLADALERAVYGKPMAESIGEAGSNFEGGENEVVS